MGAKEFRPEIRVLGIIAAVALVSLVWTLVTFRLTPGGFLFAPPYAFVLVVTGIAATTRVTVSEGSLEHRIAGRVRTWSLPETRVEFSELAWPGNPKQWRMVVRQPHRTTSVPLVGYSTATARAIWTALYGQPEGHVQA